MADPKQISKQNKMEIIRAFSRALKPVCPKLYVAAPDINTGEEEMAVFSEEKDMGLRDAALSIAKERILRARHSQKTV